MWYIAISAVLILVSFFATLKVGFSPDNKEEASTYTKRTGRNLWLQTAFYTVGTLLFAVLVIAYAI